MLPNYSKQGLVYGVGINDADYSVAPRTNSGRAYCRVYLVWGAMLGRCYSHRFQVNNPTYIGCSVANEWLLFSAFRAWMIEQDWLGKCLDKDIIVPGNKHYSPETCVFVTGAVNSLLTDHGSARGAYPIGVNLNKRTGRFQSYIRVDGKLKHLGSFDTPKEASDAYARAKSTRIMEVADGLIDERVAGGLRRHAALFANGDHPSMKKDD